MNKSFLEYLKQEKKRKKHSDFSFIHNTIVEKTQIQTPYKVPDVLTVENKQQPLHDEKKNKAPKDALGHAMLIFEGLEDKPKNEKKIIKNDVNDILGHANMLM